MMMHKLYCWSLVPKLEQDYLVVIYCIAIYLLVDSCKTQTFGPNLNPSQPKPNLS
jgi:hypothetical protein